MNAKQFAWYYLITNGTANVKPSYYGGTEVVDEKATYGEKGGYYMDHLVFDKGALHLIKTIGVNWGKTEAPTSEMFSEFTDTFHDPDEKEYLVGHLVLNDGTKIYYYGASLKVTDVFEMMAMMDESKQKAIELFGE